MTRVLPFTPAKLAERWQCSKTTITRMIKRGDLPRMDFPLIRIAAETVEAIENGQRKIGLGNIYVVESAGMVKIGFSIDPVYRLRNIAATSPVPVTTISVQRGERPVEKQLHERFAEYRGHGEWFHRAGRLDEWIAEGCPL